MARAAGVLSEGMSPPPDPVFTVVIPTRERLDTLRESLKTVLAQQHDGLRVLVSDNASTDGTRDYLASLTDARLHVVRTPRRLSMADNYEFALGHLPDRRGWVMLIGDDDGLVPGAASRAVALLKETRTLALRTPACAYSWPSLTGLPHGRLGVPLGRGVERRDSRTWLTRVMRGHASYHELPMLYQGGLAAVSLLDAMKARTGTFYRSCIPDVYSAMAITSATDAYTWSAEPLAINGLSGHSIGMSQGKDGFAAGSPARRFQAENTIAFHADVPLRDDGDYPVGQAIVYEPYLQARAVRDYEVTTHEAQLVLVLATFTPEQHTTMGTWPARFAALHGLDLVRAQRRARAVRAELRMRQAALTARVAVSLTTLGSEDLPLRTVAEAAVAAGVVRDTVPGPAANLPKLAVKAWRRVARRLLGTGSAP